MMIQWEHALIGVLVFFLMLGVGKWLFKKDTEQEKRLKSYGIMGNMLSKYGFVRFPRLLLNMSVKDFSGAAHELKELIELSQSPEKMKEELREVLHKAISEASKDPAELVKLRTLLNATVAQAQAQARALLDAQAAPLPPTAPPVAPATQVNAAAAA